MAGFAIARILRTLAFFLVTVAALLVESLLGGAHAFFAFLGVAAGAFRFFAAGVLVMAFLAVGGEVYMSGMVENDTFGSVAGFDFNLNSRPGSRGNRHGDESQHENDSHENYDVPFHWNQPPLPCKSK